MARGERQAESTPPLQHTHTHTEWVSGTKFNTTEHEAVSACRNMAVIDGFCGARQLEVRGQEKLASCVSRPTAGPSHQRRVVLRFTQAEGADVDAAAADARQAADGEEEERLRKHGGHQTARGVQVDGGQEHRALAYLQRGRRS